MRIVMKNISKHFGNVWVLHSAEFSLEPGEVHALMGENGAGKSTMMKILTGVYKKDEGSIFINNEEVSFSHAKKAEEAGISFVHQELNSLLDMTIEENIFLGREIYGAFGKLDKPKMKEKAKNILRELGVDLDPDTVLLNLSVGQRQLVEIAKAFLVESKVIILDEPTAALTDSEVNKLFDIIQNLKQKGVAFIYISHRMEEIFQICDRATVMRDGRTINTVSLKDTTQERLIQSMIGRTIENLFSRRLFNKQIIEKGETILEVQELSKRNMFSQISFKVHSGEILGVAGLMGSGRSEIMHTIFGSYTASSGKLFIKGKEIILKNHNPEKARNIGIAFIPEDRKEEGLLIENSIMHNISLTNFFLISGQKKGRTSIIQSNKEKKLSEEAIEQFRIRCTGIDHICEKLSGGNQQKVSFAKWLFTKPKILILDEPTRGVDIGAKQEIYKIITELAKEGVAIIMVSSELPEILGMSDRIIVIHEGNLAGVIDREEASQEKIMTLATGGKINE